VALGLGGGWRAGAGRLGKRCLVVEDEGELLAFDPAVQKLSEENWDFRPCLGQW